MSKHTPTPWTIHPNGEVISERTNHNNLNPVVIYADSFVNMDDAEHIIRCVNAHDDLLSTLRGIQTLIKDGGDIRDMVSWVDAAIAIAKAEENET